MRFHYLVLASPLVVLAVICGLWPDTEWAEIGAVLVISLVIIFFVNMILERVGILGILRVWPWVRYKFPSFAPAVILLPAAVNAFDVNLSSYFWLSVFSVIYVSSFVLLRAMGNVALDRSPDLLLVVLPTSIGSFTSIILACSVIGAHIGGLTEGTAAGVLHGAIGGGLVAYSLFVGFRKKGREWFDKTSPKDNPLRLSSELASWQLRLALVTPPLTAAALSTGLNGPLSIEGLLSLEWGVIGRGGVVAATVIASLITFPLSALPALMYDIARTELD